MTPSPSELTSPIRVPKAFRFAAVASVAGLQDSVGNFALDACIPTRITTDERPGTLDGRARLVFLHVDGATSLQDIASRTDLSLTEAISVCLELVALGVVHIAVGAETTA
jgi:hypothetical protein